MTVGSVASRLLVRQQDSVAVMLHSSVINTAACFRACRQQHSVRTHIWRASTLAGLALRGVRGQSKADRVSLADGQTTTQAQALPASTRPAPSFHYRPRSRSSRPALAAAPKPASRRRTVKQPAHSSPAASMPAESGAYAEHLRAAADAVERAGRLCVAVRSPLTRAAAAASSPPSSHQPPSNVPPAVQVRQSFLSDRAATEAATVSKADQTPVTVADFSVQALLSLELGARFPAVPLVAEEDAAALRAPGAAALLAQARCVGQAGGDDGVRARRLSLLRADGFPLPAGDCAGVALLVPRAALRGAGSRSDRPRRRARRGGEPGALGARPNRRHQGAPR